MCFSRQIPRIFNLSLNARFIYYELRPDRIASCASRGRCFFGLISPQQSIGSGRCSYQTKGAEVSQISPTTQQSSFVTYCSLCEKYLPFFSFSPHYDVTVWALMTESHCASYQQWAYNCFFTLRSFGVLSPLNAPARAARLLTPTLLALPLFLKPLSLYRRN